MTTVAVIGASGPLGRSVVERLDEDRSVATVLGLDVTEPDMPAGKLSFRVADARDPLLDRALAGAEAVIALPGAPDGPVDEDTSFAMVVGGTRNVLAAAGKVGPERLVHVSSATVYGAHPDNRFPLDEGAPLRANPDFPFAYHQLLAEELVAAWAEEHPSVRVAVLRPTTTLGPGVDDFVTRHLESPRLPLVRSCEPVAQFVHLDDVAAAVHLACTGDLTGPYNVAADGWLSAAEVSSVLGRRPLALPEEVAFSAVGLLWARGLSPLPPGALCYLMYPWVVDTGRLKAAGWSPSRSNREVLREFAAGHGEYVSLGRVRLRRRTVRAAAAGTVGTAGGLAAWRARQRHRDT